MGSFLLTFGIYIGLFFIKICIALVEIWVILRCCYKNIKNTLNSSYNVVIFVIWEEKMSTFRLCVVFSLKKGVD